MRFRKQTPEELLKGNSDKVVKVLDGIEEHKEQIVEKSVRFYNTPLLTELSLLRKRAEEYGYPTIPKDFHKDQLDAMILNAQNVMSMKGSHEGLKLWLWVLTFGNINLNYQDFYPEQDFIILSDTEDEEDRGLVSAINPPDPNSWYLFSGADNFGKQVLVINIETKYHYMLTLRNYINNHIKEFIGFVEANAQITITLSPGVYNTYDFPEQYYVIP